MIRILISTFILLFGFTFSATSYAQSKNIIAFSTPSSISNGKKALNNGEIVEAITLLNKSIKNGLSKEAGYSANNHLCVAYYLKEDFKKGIEACNTAIKTISNRWEAYNNRGNIHLANGKYKLAIQDYKKGLKLKRSSQLLKTNLSIAMARSAKLDFSGKTIYLKKKPRNSARNHVTPAP